MLDKILAAISLAMIIAFCTLLISYVGRIDLAIIIIICLAMAAYDMLIFDSGNKG
jgi:hypothetical protein